ncbi:hypothetical protein JQ581_29900 [Bradyrhizobium liaoningense]|uniref:hypothetical protein n=1 Tax=Bradyrhizobium liaoningense TaxID=43992 RepID=UPI001BADDE68|nr:hypothetical protein [Bradyrhizobium liaoningense]MBR0741153.1 hypothetical protein [Bradyrhizobium liaoningense]
MATLDFPASPTLGQTYSVAGSPTYQWDGEKWAVTGGGGSGATGAVRYDVAQTLTSAQQKQARDNIAAVLHGHLWGLSLSMTGSSATFSVAPGVAADSTASDKMTLVAALSKTTGAWAPGSGNGALDTGTIANNTWYHVFIIKNPATAAVDALISMTPLGPAVPSGFTLSRRIGSMKTNASGQWVLFHQLGDEFLWDVPVGDVNTASFGVTSTLFALSVPTGIQVNALCRIAVVNNTAITGDLFSSPDESVQTVSTPLGNMTIAQAAAANYGASPHNIRTNTNGQIRGVGSANGTTLQINTHGWIDRRGRDQ